MFPKHLKNKLADREKINAFRQLGNRNGLVDFSSNDYLGFSKSEVIFKNTIQFLEVQNLKHNGATGSRLITGNHKLYNDVEQMLAENYNSESALIFSSGYDANLGFFSCVPQRNDIILHDELVHASIRDGITMSKANSYKFRHNDLEDLKRHLKRSKEILEHTAELYVVTESVFSMDGDTPNLIKLSELCKDHNANLIIDEAHAIGVFGHQGKGLIFDLGLEKDVFARIITFGKALGGHGAAILGSDVLKQFLINFCRPFIYTTGLSPHSLATIFVAHKELNSTKNIESLRENINTFKTETERLKIENCFLESDSAIQCCIIPGNDYVKDRAIELQAQGFDVRPILSPTVKEGKERLRFCLHSFNSTDEIRQVLKHLEQVLKK